MGISQGAHATSWVGVVKQSHVRAQQSKYAHSRIHTEYRPREFTTELGATQLSITKIIALAGSDVLLGTLETNTVPPPLNKEKNRNAETPIRATKVVSGDHLPTLFVYDNNGALATATTTTATTITIIEEVNSSSSICINGCDNDIVLLGFDSHDVDNPQACSAYAEEIVSYWRQTELQKAPSMAYMSRQTDINEKMREILVDWIIEVHLQFRLSEDTLFLSINILDRFLEHCIVSRTKLQLVGCTALLIAAKYEEVYAPEIYDYICICDNAYKGTQFISMETTMLAAINWNLTVPTALNFMERFSKLCSIERGGQVWCLSLFFTEITLQSYVFLTFSPSAIACAALYLSMSTAKHAMGLAHEPVWTSQEEKMIGYTISDLHDVIHALYALILSFELRTAKYKAAKNKFSLTKYLEVAKYACAPPPSR